MHRPGDRDFLAAVLEGNALTRILLLLADLRSIEFSLEDFERASASLAVRQPGLVGVDPIAMSRTFHHAKTFVCAMRRFARLLEAARDRRSEYPCMIAAAIDREWRAHRHQLDRYRKPRDAIEHIDGEVTQTNHRFLSFRNDYFEVVGGTGAPVSRAALGVAASIWLAIANQAERTADARRPGGAIGQLLAVLRRRASSTG